MTSIRTSNTTSAGPKKRGRPAKKQESKSEFKSDNIPPPAKKRKIATVVSSPQPTRASTRTRHPASKAIKSAAPVVARLLLPSPPPYPSLSTWSSAWVEPPLAPTISFDFGNWVPTGADTLKRAKRELTAVRKEIKNLEKEVDEQMGDGKITKGGVVRGESLGVWGLGREEREAVRDAKCWGVRPLVVLRELDYLVGEDF